MTAPRQQRFYASTAGGVCVMADSRAPQVVNVRDMTRVAPDVAHIVYGAIDDWDIIEADSFDSVVRETAERHRIARVVGNVEICLIGVSDALQLRLLIENEDLLKSVSSVDDVGAALLRAPIASSERLATLAVVCLANGLAAMAALLERTRDSQPLVRRIADLWLSLDEKLFVEFPRGRSHIWSLATSSRSVADSIEAKSSAEVENSWARLAFQVKSPAERTAIARLAKAVSTALFPDSRQIDVIVDSPSEVEAAEYSSDKLRDRRVGRARHLKYEQVLKQVEAISIAVSQGRDAKARRFLNELVSDQMAYAGGEIYVVKSLCNIAQQCADMFRTDFEYECLRTATHIEPADSWTLVQLADHYKRVGRFDEAIDTLARAEAFGGGDIARTSLADVFVRMGRFDEASAIYKGIKGGDSDAVVRGAMADLLRLSGRLDEAEREYDAITLAGLSTHRIIAGRAEIAKRKGQLQEADNCYSLLLNETELDTASQVVYRLAHVNVLVRLGDLKDAYRRADEAVQLRPFARQARAMRAAVAGLLGNVDEAMLDVPQLGKAHAFNEWVNEYVRGLLLLMLDRYEDARKALLQKVEARFLDDESSAVLRLGAAVCFMRERDDLSHADALLRDAPPVNDALASAIRVAFRYHIAAAWKEERKIEKLRRELEKVDDLSIRKIIDAIDNKKWYRAWELEVQSLLRLAA